MKEAVIQNTNEHDNCAHHKVHDAAVIHNQKDDSHFVQSADDTILRAALRAGLGYSYECNSGGCGGCKFELVEGEIDNLWPEAPGLTPRDRARGRHLACQCRALGPISIRATTSAEYTPFVPPIRQKARLIGMMDITKDIREFRFKAEKSANFLAGQFAMLELPGVGSSRAYSMSNIANNENEWHFQIRYVENGLGTSFLFNQLGIGDEIEIDGPYGLAWLREDSPRDIVCIAGGSGLAPMISIARGAAQKGLLKDRKLYFLYGARTPEDVCGEDILRELGQDDAIKYIPIVSVPGVSNWDGETGFAHDILRKIIKGDFKDYDYYFAGPTLMLQAVQELLMVEKCVSYHQVHYDRFF
jgi:toluene monooxygenase electron transfer component